MACRLICGPMFSGKTTALVWTYSELAVSGRNPVVLSHSCDTRYGGVGVSTHSGVSVPCVRTSRLGDVVRDFRKCPKPAPEVISVSFSAGSPACEVVTAALTSQGAGGADCSFSVIATRHVIGDSELFTANRLRDALFSFSEWSGLSLDALRRGFVDAAIKQRAQQTQEYDAVLVDEAQFFPDLVEAVRTWRVYSCVDVWVHGLDGDYLGRRFGSVLDIMPWCDSVTKLTGVCNVCGGTSTMSLRLTPDKTAENEALVGTDQYAPVCPKCHADGNPATP